MAGAPVLILRPHPGLVNVIQDIRYAVRKLSRTPGFTAIAAFTLALAIGATTAIFSVIDGVLLKPLPFRDPERVVRVTNMRNGNRQSSSVPDFLDFPHTIEVVLVDGAGR